MQAEERSLIIKVKLPYESAWGARSVTLEAVIAHAAVGKMRFGRPSGMADNSLHVLPGMKNPGACAIGLSARRANSSNGCPGATVSFYFLEEKNSESPLRGISGHTFSPPIKNHSWHEKRFRSLAPAESLARFSQPL